MVFFRKYKKGKKGNAVLDGLVIMVLLVSLTIISVVCYMVFDYINTDIQNDDSMNADAKAISGDLYGKYNELFDNIILFSFVLLTVFGVVSVFLIDTHPIFFVISLILLIGVFIVAALLGNVYDDLMNDTELSVYANQFSYSGWLMRNILQVSMGVCFLMGIALYAKFKVF